MNQDNLTKEEIKLIKMGRAYRTWRKRVVVTTVVVLLWAFFGMPLAHMNNITSAIYTIGLLVGVSIEYYVIVLTCWKCPKCHKKLPIKNRLKGVEPFLVKYCSECGEDLTK